MHRSRGGRGYNNRFRSFNKSPLLHEGLFFSSKIISFCAIQCFSGTRLSPLNFSLLRFLRPSYLPTPKVPFSFPLLLFVRRFLSTSSFSFPYLCLSFTVHPLHQLPLPFSPRVSSVISTSASRGNSLSACRVPSRPLQPFRVVYHFSSASANPLFPIHQSSTTASFPWKTCRDSRCEFRSHKVSTI